MDTMQLQIKNYMNSADENKNFNHQRLIINAVTTPVIPPAYCLIRNTQWQSRAEGLGLPNTMTITIIMVDGITTLYR